MTAGRDAYGRKETQGVAAARRALQARKGPPSEADRPAVQPFPGPKPKPIPGQLDFSGNEVA